MRNTNFKFIYKLILLAILISPSAVYAEKNTFDQSSKQSKTKAKKIGQKVDQRDNLKSNSKVRAISNNSSSGYKRKKGIRQIASGVQKAIEALEKDPFSIDSIWSQPYLTEKKDISDLIKKFQAGKYANKLRNINIKNVTKEELARELKEKGFQKKEPEGRMDELLGRGIDKEYQNAGEIYVAEDGSMVRIIDSVKRRRKKHQSYFIMSVLKDPNGPINWNNEAFKVTEEWQPVPKALRAKNGLKVTAPRTSGKKENQGWLELINDAVHIDLVG